MARCGFIKLSPPQVVTFLAVTMFIIFLDRGAFGVSYNIGRINEVGRWRS